MIIYNVTINVEDSVGESWLDYMKNEHIPDVMKTNCFVDYKFSKILTRHDGETGTTYAVQYRCDSMAKLEEYQEKFAPALQKDHTEKYRDKFVAFRTLLEEV